MPFSTYATLSTALGTWRRRTFTTAQTDEFIALAEAEANQILGPTFRRQTSATVNTTTAGVGTLPTDFDGMISIVRDVVGSLPLTEVSWDALIRSNPYEVSDEAAHYAIRGTSFMVAPVVDDDFVLSYKAKLAALTASNTSNWLLAQLPNYYLFMGQSYAAIRFEAFDVASNLRGLALGLLGTLVSNDMVAQYSDAEMLLPMQVVP